jgi:hypothetical protein
VDPDVDPLMEDVDTRVEPSVLDPEAEVMNAALSKRLLDPDAALSWDAGLGPTQHVASSAGRAEESVVRLANMDFGAGQSEQEAALGASADRFAGEEGSGSSAGAEAPRDGDADAAAAAAAAAASASAAAGAGGGIDFVPGPAQHSSELSDMEEEDAELLLLQEDEASRRSQVWHAMHGRQLKAAMERERQIDEQQEEEERMLATARAAHAAHSTGGVTGTGLRTGTGRRRTGRAGRAGGGSGKAAGAAPESGMDMAGADDDGSGGVAVSSKIDYEKLRELSGALEATPDAGDADDDHHHSGPDHHRVDVLSLLRGAQGALPAGQQSARSGRASRSSHATAAALLGIGGVSGASDSGGGGGGGREMGAGGGASVRSALGLGERRASLGLGRQTSVDSAASSAGSRSVGRRGVGMRPRSKARPAPRGMASGLAGARVSGVTATAGSSGAATAKRARPLGSRQLAVPLVRAGAAGGAKRSNATHATLSQATALEEEEDEEDEEDEMFVHEGRSAVQDDYGGAAADDDEY